MVLMATPLSAKLVISSSVLELVETSCKLPAMNDYMISLKLNIRRSAQLYEFCTYM